MDIAHLTFPLFIIVNYDTSMPIIAEVDGCDCVLIYNTKELAELYTSSNRAGICQIDEHDLTTLLTDNPDIDGIIVNGVSGGHAMRLIERANFLGHSTSRLGRNVTPLPFTNLQDTILSRDCNRENFSAGTITQ